MNKTVSFTIEVPLESLEDLSKGNVSRYRLGEGRKLGPRKKFNLKKEGGENANN